MGEYNIGQIVIFVDSYGKEHHALVIYVWKSSLNIVYVSPSALNDDSFGHERIKMTSVPFFEKGMTGFYIK